MSHYSHQSMCIETISPSRNCCAIFPATHTDRSIVIVISGPSGVGKDAAIKRLQEVRSDIHFVVTATSRPKRQGEVEGVDYIFVDKAQFEEWIDAGEMLEHALVYGQYKVRPRIPVPGSV
eukprot:scaffold656687_cov62-Prasinocladus_malaysianus.AAC.1